MSGQAVMSSEIPSAFRTRVDDGGGGGLFFFVTRHVVLM